MIVMQTEQKPIPNVAFKEWGVVCAALAEVAQKLIVRKGGIHEGEAGFRVAHRRFWLYPTMFHQQPGMLKPGAEEWLTRWSNYERRGADVPLQLIATVNQVEQLTQIEQLAELETQTILSRATLEQRFYYREPGLFVLYVTIELLPVPHWITETAEMAGCKSWVTVSL
jgi:hypothetical protein